MSEVLRLQLADRDADLITAEDAAAVAQSAYTIVEHSLAEMDSDTETELSAEVAAPLYEAFEQSLADLRERLATFSDIEAEFV